MRNACTLLCLIWLGCACGHAAPRPARTSTTEALHSAYGWLAIDSVPLYQQERADDDSGPTALAMVLAYWHPAWPRPHEGSAATAKALLPTDEALRDRARALGFEASVVEGTLADIESALGRGRPLIARMIKRSVVVVERYEVIIGLHRRSQRVATLDPSVGLRTRSLAAFLREWTPGGRKLLVVLPQPPAQLALR